MRSAQTGRLKPGRLSIWTGFTPFLGSNQNSAFDNGNIVKALRNTHMQLTYRYSATHYMPLPCLHAHAHSPRADRSLHLTVTAWRCTLCIVDSSVGA